MLRVLPPTNQTYLVLQQLSCYRLRKVVAESTKQSFFWQQILYMLPRFSGPRQTCFRQVIEFPCIAWLPRNFIQSEVCIHVTCNNLIYCKSGLKLGGKTRNMFSTHFAAVPKQVAGYFCPFHRSLRLDQNRKPRMKSLRHQGYLDGDQHLRTRECCLKRFHSHVEHLEYKWDW